MSIELSEQEVLRRQSLKALRELGINPYPAARFEVNASAREIAEQFDPEKGPPVLETTVPCALAFIIWSTVMPSMRMLSL